MLLHAETDSVEPEDEPDVNGLPSALLRREAMHCPYPDYYKLHLRTPAFTSTTVIWKGFSCPQPPLFLEPSTVILSKPSITRDEVIYSQIPQRRHHSSPSFTMAEQAENGGEKNEGWSSPVFLNMSVNGDTNQWSDRDATKREARGAQGKADSMVRRTGEVVHHRLSVPSPFLCRHVRNLT